MTTENKEINNSYADELVQMIWLFMGLAFMIIFLSGALLLFLSGEQTKLFVIKTIVMFVCYLIVYIIFSHHLERKIRKSFEPLDKLKNVISDNNRKNEDIRSLARNLSNKFEKMEDMEKELDDTKKNLENIYEINDETFNAIDGAATNIDSLLDARKRELKSLADTFKKESELLSDMELSVTKLKDSKNQTSRHSESIRRLINEVKVYCDDTNTGFTDSNDAHTVLTDMLNKSQELIDGIYSELTVLQDLVSKINLSSVNAALDVARMGYSISIISAIDEIKTMSAKINEKTDSIALSIIQEKNAIKLATDQADFSKNELDLGEKSFGDAYKRLSKISDEITMLMNSSDTMIDNIYTLTGFTGELYAHDGRKSKYIKSFKDMDDKLVNQISRMYETTAKNK